MAKVKGAKAMREAIEAALPSVRRPDNMRKYGEQAVEMIKLRTRLGDGVERDGAQKAKLKRLSDSTVEDRKRADERGELHAHTTPKRSNLTRTGQLLDSVQVTSVSIGKVTVGPKGSRKGESVTNQDVGDYVTDGGRPFNNLSKVEQKRIQDAVKKDLRTEIKRRLTKE